MADYPNSLKDLYYALGFVTAQWADIEHSIDNCISLIFLDLDGINIAKKRQVPRSMNNKLDYLRKALCLPQLSLFKDDGLKIIERIEPISKERQDIIHGIMFEVNPDHIEFTKLDYTKDEHIDRFYKFTIEDINQSGKRMQGLAGDLHAYTGYLLHHFHPDLWPPK